MTDIYFPFASQPIDRPTRRLVVDPITRIEGHLRIEADVRGGQVTDAWSSGTMFRGIELVLQGRDPRDAWVFAQRICGVCTTVHALASVRAVEDALELTVPDNAQLIRHLIAGAQYLQDHVVHFYHLHSPDWVDFVSALSADPAATSALAQSISDWPESTPEDFSAVKDRLQAFADSGQMGIFGGAYWGHPAYQLSPEANLLLVSHYLAALNWQKEVIKVHALLGGKNPHPQTYLVGGMAIPMDPDSPDALNRVKLELIRSFAAAAHEFVEKVYLPDLLLLASSYPEWSELGLGVGRFLSLGGFPGRTGSGAHDPWLPEGVLGAPDLGLDPAPAQPDEIREFVNHSWYNYPDESEGKHPLEGETNPDYTGPEPPFELLDTDGKYSWLKAPRYGGLPMEVGPLARTAIAYASGHEAARRVVDAALASWGVGQDALFSTTGRMVARGVETLLVAEQMPVWLDELDSNMSSGNLSTHDGRLWEPSSWPAEAEGWAAVAAPRGALTHWVRIRDGKIAHYQAVVPSTWNGSPRDREGKRGPWEEALMGTPVADEDRPLELLRTVHSFDPCLACAVHVVDAGSDA